MAEGVENLTTPVIDVSDILRAQLVFAVSALDQFVHELIRLGMIEIAKGNRPKTRRYNRFPMAIVTIESVLQGLPAETLISDAVRMRHSWLSFQDPSRIAEAVKLISSTVLWDAVGRELGMTGESVQTRLKLITDRRNKIAHEADVDPANPGFRWPITKTLATESVEFIERVAIAIGKTLI
ncbi:MAG: hypothetical protein KGJ66_09540 [Alphaproteobacteria bacterium]|nr:hypothetical protein [Alphaproteobacteria bacterium]